MTARDHGVTDDDGNLLLGQRGDGSPIWNDPEDPLPLQRVAHFTEEDARRKMWELAGAGYGPTGLSKLHHSGIAAGVEASQDDRCPNCDPTRFCTRKECNAAGVKTPLEGRDG